MRRPAQKYGPLAANGWAHPYSGLAGLAVFYNDGGNTPPPVPPAPTPPKPTPPAPPTGTFTQEDLDRIAAKEKDQGKRAGAKEALEKFAADHGFSNVDDAAAFIAAARQAEDAKKSEEQKRQEELDRREREIADRESAALARERNANRRAVLVGLGATGDDLDDAAALLRLPDDADDTAVAEAAAKLKERRPELFGVKPADPAPGHLPPAPGGAPAGGPPARQAAAGKPGDRGRAIAAARGHKTATV